MAPLCAYASRCNRSHTLSISLSCTIAMTTKIEPLKPQRIMRIPIRVTTMTIIATTRPTIPAPSLQMAGIQHIRTETTLSSFPTWQSLPRQ